MKTYDRQSVYAQNKLINNQTKTAEKEGKFMQEEVKAQ